MTNFTGVKAALLFGNDQLLIIQRDNKPGLPFAGLWDFAGGSREGNETPIECIAREIKEELDIKINEGDIVWQKQHQSMLDPKLNAYFVVIKISAEQINAIKFGDEGLGWKLISIEDFMRSSDVVEPLKARLQGFLTGKR